VRATSDDSRIRLLYRWLPQYVDPQVWHQGLRLAAVHANHRRPYMEKIARHQITSRALPLMLTVGPTSFMVAP
jgi:hypothetical protein